MNDSHANRENTHQRYNTVDHLHLDSFVYRLLGDFPDAGLSLVSCSDGRWFVEVDHGKRFDSAPGLSRPQILPFSEPRFFEEQDLAAEFALESIAKAYPQLADCDLKTAYKVYFKRQ